MIPPKVDLQASMYVFDLNNSAKEHWFKPNEHWELSLASEADRTAIEKKYRPTLSVKGLPETLIRLQTLVKAKLAQGGTEATGRNLVSDQPAADLLYLIAFNPDRLR